MKTFSAIKAACILFIMLQAQAQAARAATVPNKYKYMYMYKSIFHPRNLATSTSTSTSTKPTPKTSKAKSKYGKADLTCKPKGECELCTGGQRSGREECKETGKRQKTHCYLESSSTRNANANANANANDNDNDNEDDDAEYYVDYNSCKRTRFDEDYLMVSARVNTFVQYCCNNTDGYSI